jgi:hypothetical protein
MGRITRAEWRWVFLFAAVVMAVLTVPYLLGYSFQGEGWRFSGFVFGVQDGNSYIADMREGAEGAWLFRIPYTNEPQRGALLYLPFLLLGKLAGGAAMHEQLVALFHLARIAAGIAMLLAAYYFLACFFEDVTLRRWGVIAAGFGGGFGWILLAKPGAYPLEFTSPEAFGFLSLFGLPHLAAARALLLLALAWFASPAAEKPARTGIKVGLALAVGWLFQPLIVVVAWAVIAAYLVLVFLRARIHRTPISDSLRPRLIQALVAAAVTLPPILYSALAFTLDPVLRQWTAQNILPAPPVWDYLLSYGVLLLPALAGALLVRREDDRWLLPVGWLIVVPALVYLPLSIQRRLSDGFWMALIVLALLFTRRKLGERARRAALVAAMFLLLPAAALFYGRSMVSALAPMPPASLPAAEVRAFEWLDANAESGAVVLSTYEAGNALPAYADLVSFTGHGPETLHNTEKMILAETVLDGAEPEEERLAALVQSGARYVLVDPEHAAQLGAGIPGCRLIYRENGWDVWEVQWVK